MRKFALVLLSMLATVASADSWLCIADQATGFNFKNGKWNQVRFNVGENSKYIIRPFKEGDQHGIDYTHGVFNLGEQLPVYFCKKPDYDIFYCEGYGDFNFDGMAGKYLMTYTQGYWQSDDEYEGEIHQSPFLEIGRCSKI